MIIVRLKGGLGNQMFEYAAGRHLALKNNTELKLDLTQLENDPIRNYELDPFNISGSVASKKELDRLVKRSFFSKLVGKKFRIVKQKNLYYDASILKLKGDIILDGYWQCESYFKEIEDTIRKDFLVKEKPNEENKNLLDRIKKCESVALHIRRTDYVTNSKTNAFHGICSIAYYQHALTIIERKVKKPVIFVFSDDQKWANENLKFDHPTTFVEINEPDKGYKDLRLMHHSKHFIIANSSFSWWGAWLSTHSHKIICAPKQWFVKENEGDILPKSWIRAGD